MLTLVVIFFFIQIVRRESKSKDTFPIYRNFHYVMHFRRRDSDISVYTWCYLQDDSSAWFSWRDISADVCALEVLIIIIHYHFHLSQRRQANRNTTRRNALGRRERKCLQMLGDITNKDYVTLKRSAEDRSSWQKSLSYGRRPKKRKKHRV